MGLLINSSISADACFVIWNR